MRGGWRLVDKQTGEEKFILKISSRGKNSQETTKLRRKTKKCWTIFFGSYTVVNMGKPVPIVCGPGFFEKKYDLQEMGNNCIFI